jgi:restriction endonuclease Mrr
MGKNIFLINKIIFLRKVIPMIAFSVAASLLIIFLILDRVQNILNRRRELQIDENSARLEVLKIVVKDELYRFRDRETVNGWVTRLLQMSGYTELKAKTFDEDSAYDYLCMKGNQQVYVACKLWNVKDFDAPVTQAAAQKLVGAMVGGRVKKGLIITAGALTDEARTYLKALPVSYRIEVLDGITLMDKLHALRKTHLEPLPET